MFDKIIQNTCKPKGLGGKMILKMMNTGHAKLSEWGLSYLNFRSTDNVLDIGCGGGANIARMLQKCTEGKVCGIDYSEESVNFSIKNNRKNIGEKCEIKVGSVDNIPFDDMIFDIATAFETVYFWPDLRKNFEEVKRVLKPNGHFLVCCEEGDPENDQWSDKIKGMKVYGIMELVKLLKDAGFAIEKAEEKPNGKWICILARKKDN